MTHALLIDGENISSRHAATLIAAIPSDCAVRRVYGNVSLLNGWMSVPDLCAIHTPTARNAADIRLAIDAVERFHHGIRDFTVATGDGGLASLVTYLREGGARVTVYGRANTPAPLRAASHAFFELEETQHGDVPAPIVPPRAPSPKPSLSKLETFVVARLSEANGTGLALTSVNGAVHKALGIHIGALSEKTWNKWFAARPALFRLDPPGPTARVRLATR